MFFKKKPPPDREYGEAEIFPNFVKNKVLHCSDAFENRALELAKLKIGGKNVWHDKTIPSLLTKGAYNSIRMSAILLGNAVEEPLGRRLTSIEWGDAILLATYILKSPVRHVDPSINEAFIYGLREALEEDAYYLLYAPQEVLDDLIEDGDEEYASIEKQKDAVLPLGYLHRFTHVLRDRSNGNQLPYRLRDHFPDYETTMITALKAAMPRVQMINAAWVSTVHQLQVMAEDDGETFWEWFE